MRTLALALFLLPTLAAEDSLAGRWVATHEVLRMDLELDEDGSYRSRVRLSGVEQHDAGTWKRSGANLVFRTGEGAIEKYTLSQDGDVMNWTGELLGDMTLTFRRERDGEEGSGLGGTWRSADGEMQLDVMIGDRYRLAQRVAGVPVSEEGRLSIENGRLVLRSDVGLESSFDMIRQGNRLRLSSAMLVEPITLQRIPGSARELEAKAEREAKEKEAADERWRQRIALSKRDPGGEGIPGDPGAQRVFTKGKVFAEPQLYGWDNWGSTHRVLTPPDPGPGHPAMRLTFTTTGRALFQSFTYTLVTETHSLCEVAVGCGRYRIEDDVILLEMDSGERHRLPLENGRRTLILGATPFENVHSALEALESRDAGEKAGPGGRRPDERR